MRDSCCHTLTGGVSLEGKALISRTFVGIVLLLGASEALGLLLGQWFYGLFVKTIPPLAMSSFNLGTAHAAYVIYGLIGGLAIFVLGLAAAASSRFFKDAPGKR